MENGSIVWDTILVLLFRENLLKNFAWTSWWFRCTSKSFLFVALYLPRKKFQRGAKHNSVHTVELSWRPIIFWTDGHEKKLHRVSKLFNFRATIAPNMNFGMIAQVSNAIFLQWFRHFCPFFAAVFSEKCRVLQTCPWTYRLLAFQNKQIAFAIIWKYIQSHSHHAKQVPFSFPLKHKNWS